MSDLGNQHIVLQEDSENPERLDYGTGIALYPNMFAIISARSKMVVYKAKHRISVKWLVAGIIFIATLCITFNDLYGAHLPY